MKYLAFLIVSLLFFVSIPVYAMTATTAGVPAATGAAQQVDKTAQELLDKVATKVAELTAKQRNIYVGTIKTAGTVSYTVTTGDGDKTVTTTEGTNFYRIRAGNRTDATFKSIKASDDIGAVGTIDPQTGEMTAKQVIAKIQRQNIVGVIESLGKDGAASISGTRIDLTSAGTLKKVDKAGKISTAKVADFAAGNVAFVIAYASDNSGVLSSLKAMVLSK